MTAARVEQRGGRTIDGDLMSFRTTWLRAVARAWGDERFRGELVDDPRGTLQRRLGFAWPWDHIIDFAVAQDQGLQWAGDDWVWPTDHEDSLTLYLPITRRPDVDLRPRALADYYAQRPSIFGTAGGGGGSTPRSQSLVTSAGLDITDADGMPIASFMLAGAPVRFAGLAPPNGGFIPNSGTFADFEVVLLSALAKAWDNDAFATLIQADEPVLRVALSSIRGYSPPWRLTLRVLDDENATYNAESSRWDGLTPHQLALNLPDRPASIPEQALALAAYNSTGAEFPFTCCA
jgi:ribosomally synthesized peptide (two-chain TOMM family)